LTASSGLSLLKHVSPQQLLEAVRQEKLRRNIEVIRAEHGSRGYRDEDGIWRGGLLSFIRYFWHVLEPAVEFKEGWAIEAVCEHLEAVTFGEIQRLLVNLPPGFCKSLIVDVFWPAWEWGPMGMSHLRYVAFSYTARITDRDNNKFGVLVGSLEYQRLYGHKVVLDKTGEKKISNGHMGWKLASSVGGVGTGERGDRVILDDAHNVKEAESEIVRTDTVRWFREAMSNRLNDPTTGAIVIIMQRVHGEDISGVILDLGLPYCHLMIPMEFDPDRALDDEGQPIATAIGWIDPRLDVDDPESGRDVLAWEERFPKAVCDDIKAEVGPFAWAAQYQQTPEQRGGGIFQRLWWQVWDPPDGRFPALEYIVASLDSAFTEKEQNDPSGMTVWGVFKDGSAHRRIILLHAWRKRLRFHGPNVERLPKETDFMHKRRAQPHWGLVEWTVDTCRRFKVDRLLIEAKASGITAGQELQRQHGREGWAIQLCQVKGDKVARAIAVQPTFSQGMVYAPVRDWAEMVIEEMAVFPMGKFKDLTDSATQAMKHLRDIGLAQSDEEEKFVETEAVRHKQRPRALYPV
jgi:predicted phage terminase large subunit-like protein